MRKAAEGFTLIEVMVAVVILGILSSLAAASFIRQQQESRFRSAVRRVVAVLHEGRTAALSLGAASGTPRVVGVGNCPIEMLGGQPVVVVDTTAGAPTLTWISRVDRTPGVVPPTFTINCRTETFEEFRGDVALEAAGAQLGGVGPRFMIQYDGRGFLSPVPAGPFPGVARIMASSPHTPNRTQAVLVLASGVACLEGNGGGQCRGQ
jgi:prepilin-type N-terminal cleavage/methylation domain-containing protein